MNTLRTFTTGNGTSGQYYSLPALAEQGFPGISRMPVSLRIVLESLLRNCDGLKVSEDDVKNLAAWNAMPPHRPQALCPFLSKLTRRIAVSLLRKKQSFL